MLENATLVAPFGNEDTAAQSKSEVTEIKRAVFCALTLLRAAEMKEFDTIARLETQVINETF